MRSRLSLVAGFSCHGDYKFQHPTLVEINPCKCRIVIEWFTPVGRCPICRLNYIGPPHRAMVEGIGGFIHFEEHLHSA